MRKRFLLLAAAMLTAVSLFGCSKISLTEDENNMIAEYLAGVILHNEAGYTEKLATPTPIPSPTPTPVPTGAPLVTPGGSGGSGEQEGNHQASADFTQIVGIKGITVTYQSYEKKDSLFDGVMNLEVKGKELLIVSFQIENTTDQPIALNLGAAKIKYQLDSGSGDFIKPMFTALNNDLRYIDTTIEAGAKETGIVVFGIEKEQDLKTANLIISRDSLTAIINLN